MNDESRAIDGQESGNETTGNISKEVFPDLSNSSLPTGDSFQGTPKAEYQKQEPSVPDLNVPQQSPPNTVPPNPYRQESPPFGGESFPPLEQAEWTFNDYGPIGSGSVKKPPKPKKEKAEKPPKALGSGYKALSVVMCILFVLSIAGFGSYIVYDLGREGQNQSKPYLQNTPNTPADNTPSPDDVLTDGKMTNQEIYQMVEPAVVGIVGYLRGSTGTQVASQGSGIVFEENGYIVTNNHVVKIEEANRPYDKIEVIYSNGDKFDATLLGGDAETDLAVLKIDAQGLKKAIFGDSDQVRVGDKALVIGNPSGLAFAGSLTQGTVSAVHREVRTNSLSNKKTEYIQTDAAINPGNSGGALVNEYGQIIGITSAKIAKENYEGMGFAIPINNAKPIIQSLIQNGYVTGRVKIGISYKAVSDTLAELNGIPKGLRVVSIEEGSDALRKGLQKGDIITKIDGNDVYDADTVTASLEGKKPGDVIELTVYRVDETEIAKYINLQIKLIEKTEE